MMKPGTMLEKHKELFDCDTVYTDAVETTTKWTTGAHDTDSGRVRILKPGHRVLLLPRMPYGPDDRIHGVPLKHTCWAWDDSQVIVMKLVKLFDLHNPAVVAAKPEAPVADEDEEEGDDEDDDEPEWWEPKEQKPAKKKRKKFNETAYNALRNVEQLYLEANGWVEDGAFWNDPDPKFPRSIEHDHAVNAQKKRDRHSRSSAAGHVTRFV